MVDTNFTSEYDQVHRSRGKGSKARSGPYVLYLIWSSLELEVALLLSRSSAF